MESLRIQMLTTNSLAEEKIPTATTKKKPLEELPAKERTVATEANS
jgi:hypothetical protein